MRSIICINSELPAQQAYMKSNSVFIIFLFGLHKQFALALFYLD